MVAARLPEDPEPEPSMRRSGSTCWPAISKARAQCPSISASRLYKTRASRSGRGTAFANPPRSLVGCCAWATAPAIPSPGSSTCGSRRSFSPIRRRRSRSWWTSAIPPRRSAAGTRRSSCSSSTRGCASQSCCNLAWPTSSGTNDACTFAGEKGRKQSTVPLGERSAATLHDYTDNFPPTPLGASSWRRAGRGSRWRLHRRDRTRQYSSAAPRPVGGRRGYRALGLSTRDADHPATGLADHDSAAHQLIPQSHQELEPGRGYRFSRTRVRRHDHY